MKNQIRRKRSTVVVWETVKTRFYKITRRQRITGYMIVFNIQKFQRKDQTTMKVIKQMHKRNDDNRFGKFHKKLRVGKSSHN